MTVMQAFWRLHGQFFPALESSPVCSNVALCVFMFTGHDANDSVDNAEGENPQGLVFFLLLFVFFP